VSVAGGPLAVTDANVVLGRIIPQYFPQIFGTTEDQPLDVTASKNAFEDLTEEVQRCQHQKLFCDLHFGLSQLQIYQINQSLTVTAFSLLTILYFI